MGTCLSKKATNSTSPTSLPDPPTQTTKAANNTPADPDKKFAATTEHQEILKKEIFVIKHRRSHEIDRRKEEEKKPSSDREQVLEISQPGNVNGGPGFGGNGVNGVVMAATPVRTSSCTKEEVDAILIQCGRLSRSSSTGKGGSGENPNFGRSGRKYSGSKRSYDFDQEIGVNDDSGGGSAGGDEVVAEAERIHRHRNRQREPRVSSPSSSRRRRTPSRERDEQGNSQARSGSRERGSGSGGRRVSRSPGRRSESPITSSNGGHGGGNTASGNANKPGKMVSVPATVSSMAMDKSNNGGGGGGEAATGVRRIQVRRNVGEAPAVGTRTAASPRSRSPARANVKVLNENQHQEQKQQPLTLSRSNSRKAEQSPYRRNPLGDIDNNVAGNDQTNLSTNKAAMQKPNGDKMSSNKAVVAQGIDNKTITNRDYKTKEQHVVDEARGELHSVTGNVAVTLVPAGTENLKFQPLTRTRSSRRSRDFDINPETLLNPNPTYASLLLEDIQNFHQKGTPQPAFSLPQCLTKACSILEAVADLNSTTSSNLSSTYSEDRRKIPNKNNDEKSLGALEEPEMEVMGDLVEPSLHKYVTFRRGPTGGEDMEEQESSGSNSFAGSHQAVNWLSTSWEPTSADSPDCWTSSKSNTRENDFNPLGFQRSAYSESKQREPDNQRNGIGRGRLGSGRSAFSTPNVASAST